MGRPVRSDIPAERARSRLSTAGGSPYSTALRNKSARLTPCSKQSRLTSLSPDAANRNSTTGRYGAQSGSWIGREPIEPEYRRQRRAAGQPPAGRLPALGRPVPGPAPNLAQNRTSGLLRYRIAERPPVQTLARGFRTENRSNRLRVRLFFVGGPISLSGGGEAGGNWIRQGVVRSGGGAGGRRYFCRQRPMGDFRWSSRAS